MEGVLHARRTDPRIGDWLAAADGRRTTWPPRKLRHIRRRLRADAKVPARLAAEIARVTRVAQGIWAAGARRRGRRGLPADARAGCVALRREEAAALAGGGDPYDALLDDYEPGATAARGRRRCSARCARGSSRCASAILRRAGAARALTGTFAEAGQLELSPRACARPSATTSTAAGSTRRCIRSRPGSGARRADHHADQPARPVQLLLFDDPRGRPRLLRTGRSTAAYLLTPLGQGVSMGVHESQSRIYENQLGRSPRLHRLALRPDAGDLRRLRHRGRGRLLRRRQPGASTATSAPRPTRCSTTCTSCCASTWNGR